MGLTLKSGDIVFLDTAPFIYFFEAHSDYFPALMAFFDQLYETGAQAITSIVTYIELTTQPARKGDRQLVRKYRDYLSNSQNISLFPLDMNIADHAVELRATHNFSTPDAIQLGTAAACGADYIITNDKACKRYGTVEVILVGEL
jgi:predicted nucleic acid-binding protein